MKIFITGATGFIGKLLVDRLARTEHEMYCLVRATSQADTLKELGAELIEGDVTNKSSIIQGMSGCDWVVHLANLYSFWEPDKRLYSNVNIEGTQNVMECALETGVTKVMHISTALIYGKPADQPFTEESAVGPIRFSTYAQTKYEGDLIWQVGTGYFGCRRYNLGEGDVSNALAFCPRDSPGRDRGCEVSLRVGYGGFR